MDEIIKKLDKNLKVVTYKYENDTLFIDVEKKSNTEVCPHCGQRSNRIHSKYIRQIKDLPIQEYKVILNIISKVYFCKNKDCHTKTFAEQFDFVESHSRMTKRLKKKIVNTSKTMSARASKEIVNNDLANISDDTILRLLKKNSNRNKKRASN